MVEVSMIANIANNTLKASLPIYTQDLDLWKLAIWLALLITPLRHLAGSSLRLRQGFSFVQGIFLEVKESNSLIAPVQSYSDVAFDFTDLILGQVAWKQLSPQINQLVHHVTELVKEVNFMLLWGEKKYIYMNKKGKYLFHPSTHDKLV